MKNNTDYPVSCLKLYLCLIVLLAGAVLGYTFLSFKPYYKAFYNNEFIGYYKTQEDYEKFYNNLNKTKNLDGIQTNYYLENQPSFEKIYVKPKYVNSFNNSILIEQQFTKEYILYSVKVNSENKFYVKTREEADKLKEEIQKEVKESTTIEIEEIKTKDKNLLNDNDTIVKIKTEVIKTNIKVTSRGGSIKRTSKGYLWPTTSTRITSYFGPRKSGNHTGLDIGVPLNSPIYAVKSGTVIFAGWNGNYGYQVKIQHDNGVVTAYAHNNKLLVQKGDVVSVGQAIAKSGSTGNSTGPHLHIEFIVNGEFKNPLNYL